jgi:mannan endo-1,4-beta-mannosidase
MAARFILSPRPMAISAPELLDKLRRDAGVKVVSGQYDKDEMDFVRSVVGAFPVLRGIDFMKYSRRYTELAGPSADEVQQYIDDSLQHGFVNTASWHWCPSLPGVTADNYGSSFYNMQLDPDAGWEELRKDVREIALQLKRFQDAGLPVLFRPLHECTWNAWFFWSRTPDVYVRLWKMIFDEVVHVHRLSNVLFVWSPSHNYDESHAAFYPGDDFVDIIAIDYPRDPAQFAKLRKLGGGAKLIAVGEASVSDVPRYVAELGQAPYAYICCWSREQGPQTAGAAATRLAYDASRVLTLPW